MQETLGIENIEHTTDISHKDGVQGFIELELKADNPVFELVNQLLMAAALPSSGIDPSAYRIRVRIDYMADQPEMVLV